MAEKTFKIGLSDADKQNMAQDVYERLIGMCFDEYDSSKVYNEGDFVVYENPTDTFKLYKCVVESTTGTWDGDDWELATFQDLVDDIENAVAFVNDKANVDGNYPTMTVGVADQLSPYDEESGDDQDEPFSFQATGTGNGSQPDFATGAIALMKEKQGNTVVVNQKIIVVDSTGSGNGIDFTTNATTKKVTASGTATAAYATIFNNTGDYIANHKYLVIANVIKNTDNKAFTLSTQGTGNPNINVSITGVGSFAKVSTAATDKTATPFGLLSLQVDETYDLEFIVIVVDLTKWFNSDIPQDLLDNPSNFYRYYQGSLAYNTGELVNANARYIKCIGMNQWDEVAEQGSIDNSGNNTSGSYLRSKNYIRVNPNTSYYCLRPSTQKLYLYCYDANKNFVPLDEGDNHLVYKTLSANNFLYRIPNNVCYIRFVLDGNYGLVYNHDISINLYYEDEARCLTYEPYQVLTNNDTGTETLRSAGNVKDYKTPDGTIHRLVGVADLSNANVLVANSDSYTNITYCYFTMPDNSKKNADKKCITDKYPWKKASTEGFDTTANIGYIISNANVNYWWVGFPKGTSLEDMTSAIHSLQMYYELETETTEQGTSYSENLVIDDFGSMDFQGTNGVPQGNLIFYPVDYKAFIDTLYNYTEGTPSNIALKSDLTGLVAQEDLSSEITDVAGLTYNLKKAVKTGSLITMTIRFVNDTGSQISPNVALFNIGNSLTPSENIVVPAFISDETSTPNCIVLSAGYVICQSSIPNGKTVIISMTYIK